jgi:HAD superfamily hydrolase (TIGR01509 family)
MNATKPVLLFDVMGTIVHDPYDAEIPEFFGVSPSELQRQNDSKLWIEFERGRIAESDYLEGFFLDRRTFDTRGLAECIARSYRWLDGMQALLDELRAADFELHALSNYPSWYQRIEAALGLSRYLRWSFVSCVTGQRKPAPEAYLGALRTLGRGPQSCLFIDDRRSNCQAAERIGIPAVEFVDAASLRARLVQLGVLGP